KAKCAITGSLIRRCARWRHIDLSLAGTRAECADRDQRLSNSHHFAALRSRWRSCGGQSNHHHASFLPTENNMREDPYKMDWDIRREGRAWHVEEDHYFRTEARIDMVDGKLFWNDEDRLTLLAMLLE